MIFKIILSITLITGSIAIHAGVYKCTINGKITYSDKPCGNDQEKIEVHKDTTNSLGKIKKYAPQEKKGNDYYSVENQLKRMQDDRNTDKRNEMQKKIEESDKKIRDIQAANYDKDKCLIARIGAQNIKNTDPLYKTNIDWFEYNQKVKLYCFKH